MTLAQALERCERQIEAGGHAQQVSINAAKIVALRDDPRLRMVVDRAALVNADGVSVVWASRALGDPLPERVTGINLMYELIALAERRNWSVYLLGARREMLERAVARLRMRHPGLTIAGYRDGYFDDAASAVLCADVRATAPDVVFVAMGSPRTERWLGEHGHALGAALTMGVGGAVDVLAGKARRAPAAFQRLGLEWLYRLAQEPRRLLGRNLKSVTFWRMVAGELIARRRSR